MSEKKIQETSNLHSICQCQPTCVTMPATHRKLTKPCKFPALWCAKQCQASFLCSKIFNFWLVLSMLAAHLWLSFQHWPKSPKGPKTSQEGTLNEKGSEKIQKNIDKRIPKKSLRFRRSKITIVRKISLISLALAPLRLLELFRRCFGQGLLAVGLHSTCITVYH